MKNIEGNKKKKNEKKIVKTKEIKKKKRKKESERILSRIQMTIVDPTGIMKFCRLSNKIIFSKFDQIINEIKKPAHTETHTYKIKNQLPQCL